MVTARITKNRLCMTINLGRTLRSPKRRPRPLRPVTTRGSDADSAAWAPVPSGLGRKVVARLLMFACGAACSTCALLNITMCLARFGLPFVAIVLLAETIAPDLDQRLAKWKPVQMPY